MSILGEQVLKLEWKREKFLSNDIFFIVFTNERAMQNYCRYHYQETRKSLNHLGRSGYKKVIEVIRDEGDTKVRKKKSNSK